jgi:hypothetical protein
LFKAFYNRAHVLGQIWGCKLRYPVVNNVDELSL